MRRLSRVVVRRTTILLAAFCLAAPLSSCGTDDTEDPGSKLKGTPLTVGFINADTGTFQYPEVSHAAKAAADHINEQGGINGHPLRLEECGTDSTPARSVQCANEFVAKKVSLVLAGNDPALAAALPILNEAGIKVMGLGAVPDVYSDPKAVMLAAPLPVSLKVIMSTLNESGVEDLVVMMPNAGAAFKQQFDQGIKPVAAESGISATLTSTAPANPDFTAAFTAAKSAKADGVFLLYAENDCTNAIRTAKSTGFDGTVFAIFCQQFVGTLGSEAKGVYSTTTTYPVNALKSLTDTKAKSQVEIYKKVMDAAGLEKDVDSTAASGFSVVMTFADIAKQVSGEFTAENLGKAVAEFRGSYFMGGKVDCVDRLMPGATCGTGLVILKANGDETQEIVGGAFQYTSDIK